MPAMLCDTGGAFCHSSFTRDFVAITAMLCDSCVLCGVPSGSVARRCALRGKCLLFFYLGDYARGRRFTA
jgi:hypothetical protein